MHILRICMLLLILLSSLSAQDLATTYRAGTVRLEVDTRFAAGVDWSAIFSDYNAKSENTAVGTYKSLAVADDGSVFVGNYSSYDIFKFDSRGQFVKSFGREGNSPGQFRNRPTLHGVLDNRYVFTSEHNGRLNFFDLKGDFVKLIQLDYMPLSCVPLQDNKIGILGHVPYGDRGVRYIVAVMDFTSEEEEIIHSEFSSSIADDAMKVEKDGYTLLFSHHLNHKQRFLKTTANGQLVVANNLESKIDIYSPDGVLRGQLDLQIDRVEFKQAAKDEYRQSLRKSLVGYDVAAGEIEQMLAKMSFPDKLPYLYDLRVDDDDNLLVFTYTEADEDRQFQVYTFSASGGFVCETTLVLEDFDLSLSPSFNPIQFHDGYVYALVTPKADNNAPLQLIRGRLTAQ